ncbi:unnamed protein product [Cuscuta campestris]|uniref:Uncharacterized protein n=1 Tax=Cuscuta campestris TaxID=132261 RepID=A0A484ML15_9ASTE|nr:unnamed protein product [Cuscuta campestris]
MAGSRRVTRSSAANVGSGLRLTVTVPTSACQDDLVISLNDVTSQNTTDLRHRIPRKRAANVGGSQQPNQQVPVHGTSVLTQKLCMGEENTTTKEQVVPSSGTMARPQSDRQLKSKLAAETRTRKRVLRAALPDSFQMLPIPRYDRIPDPQEHFNRYQTLMNVVTFSEEVLCKSFPSTLNELAAEWKRSDEPLREFLARWKLETTKVYGADKKTRLSTFYLVLRSGDVISISSTAAFQTSNDQFQLELVIILQISFLRLTSVSFFGNPNLVPVESLGRELPNVNPKFGQMKLGSQLFL